MKKQTVLVVDDEPVNVKYIAQLLSGEYNVLLSTSGKDALILLESSDVDLILLDIHMPHMDGFEVIKRLQKTSKTSSIPVVFLTADRDESTMITGFNLGAKDFITKPFNNNELLARVKAHTDLVYLHKKLLNEKIKFESLLDNASDGIYVMDLEGNLMLYSRSFARSLGYEYDEMEGMNVTDWNPNMPKDQVAAIFHSYTKDPKTVEVQHICKDGTTFDAEISITGIVLDGKECIYCSQRDITEKNRLMEIIKQQSVTDELTQLNNRKALRERLDKMIAEYQRYQTVFSLLILDIDHFKLVNDQYGHQVGDEVLVALSKEMLSVSRKADYVFRFGGEEFVLLLTHTNLQQAVIFAEKLRSDIQKNVNIVEDMEITVSIGIAEFFKEDNYDSLIKRADDNLYKAKETGRNKVVA